ncbi:hypothetical protein QTG54_015396 [Skeletonema marinoi]|uniref:Uncharacterized protein n=1 Tax=Skeletonema marinoi TaxID=267567 RepID=A0AAD8XU01_9STRA|nr:hypothetical protein QTG54_015396 [Skeletonema marinoi]
MRRIMNDKEAGRKKEVDEIAPRDSKKIRHRRPGTAGAPIAAPSMRLGAAISSSEVEHVLSPSFAEANLNDATDGGHRNPTNNLRLQRYNNNNNSTHLCKEG